MQQETRRRSALPPGRGEEQGWAIWRGRADVKLYYKWCRAALKENYKEMHFDLMQDCNAGNENNLRVDVKTLYIGQTRGMEMEEKLIEC